MPLAPRILCALAALLPALLALPAPAGAAADARPNVVVLMTDDQTVEDLRAMPQTVSLLGSQGVTFDRSYVSYPVCCPSRATYLSGQYAHNHGVLGLYPPTGGYGRFDAAESLPVWLERSGYHTAHVGKYMNGYGTDTPDDPPPGWSEWFGAVGSSTYRMWGFTLNENGERTTYGSPFDEDPGMYQTDVLTDHAVGVIERQAARTAPLFLSVAFLAPHHEGDSVRLLSGHLVRAAPRHIGKLAARPFPVPRAFNEADVSDKPPFLRRRPRLSRAQIDRVARNWQDRQESLLAVDEAVGRIVDALRRSGTLEDTWIVFTSDNGFMQGEHRVPSGKMLPYDPSTQVPLLVRGPGLPAGAHSRELVGNVDLAPTVLELARAESHVGKTLDGRSLLPYAFDPSLTSDRPLLHETGGSRFSRARDQDVFGAPAIKQLLTYKAIRTSRWLYVRYRGGARELYDLHRDPGQLRSLHAEPRLAGVRARLGQTLAALSACYGDDCRTPY